MKGRESLRVMSMGERKRLNIVCPICGKSLIINDAEAYCEKKHHFDRAKQGYVNLLIKQGSSMRRHGDDSLMLKSRQEFLEKGFYERLADLISELINKYAMERSSIVDVGCGEGYYTEKIYNELTKHGKEAEIICVDISKEAAKRVAKRSFPKITTVASAFELPISSESCDIVINIFAPFSEKETWRILKDDGIFARVVPQERHLYGLKSKIYDVPYENAQVKKIINGFESLEVQYLNYNLYLDNNEDIDNLFKMTPYYYKTSIKDQRKVTMLKTLNTEVSFAVMIDKKVVGNK